VKRFFVNCSEIIFIYVTFCGMTNILYDSEMCWFYWLSVIQTAQKR